MKRIILLAALCAAPILFLYSRENVAYKKGTFYALWGWNRSAYTHSDIHFKGDDYRFTLYEVKARDRQSAFGYYNYFRLDRITIPQTNMRAGYFFRDDWAVSLGVDHMKYVMNANQTVDISGQVKPAYQWHVQADGSIKLTPDFLQFEHTDGLNYVNVELERYRNFYTNGVLKVNGLIGGGAGFLLPRTNVTLMGNERHDAFHLAGFGLNAKLGLDINLWNVFFIRNELKEGYINMPDIRTTHRSSDKASQAFWFVEWAGMFGFNWKF